MKLALQEAEKAYSMDEVPVGAVIVMNDVVIAKGYNQVELLNDATAHAEIIALTSAFQHLGSKYLSNARLYVTLEPCLMCAGAMYWSKIGQVIYGAEDEKNGYRKTCTHSPFHPKTTLGGGLLANECAHLMKNFFKQKRN
jgi:tRNA(adenine34) deaminase